MEFFAKPICTSCSLWVTADRWRLRIIHNRTRSTLMINMKTWEEIEADVVEELHLDPRNVRLSTSLEAPQTDIIEDLFANENALALVEGIVKIGYLTNEVPIVVHRDGQLIVVEGNRRVAALKLIQNPYLALDHQARVKKLVQAIANRDALKSIIVKLAPGQDEAD